MCAPGWGAPPVSAAAGTIGRYCSHDSRIITVFRGKSYGSLDDDRATLGTTVPIALTGRHRIHGPITKPIDNWNSVDLRRDITAGDAFTPIESTSSHLRAKGT